MNAVNCQNVNSLLRLATPPSTAAADDVNCFAGATQRGHGEQSDACEAPAKASHPAARSCRKAAAPCTASTPRRGTAGC